MESTCFTHKSTCNTSPQKSSHKHPKKQASLLSQVISLQHTHLLLKYSIFDTPAPPYPFFRRTQPLSQTTVEN